jgi:uncharacterized protein YoxC
MNLPSDTPRLPKWIFLLGDAALLFTAWAVWSNATHPTSGLPLIAVIACVVAAAAIGVIPFVADYAHRQDEALDNRQRSLQALSVTVASVSEQVSIAATGLQGIAEAAQENFSKSEQLSRQIEEKIAQLDARLAGARKDEGEVAGRLEATVKRVAELEARLAGARKEEGEAEARLEAAVKRIAELDAHLADARKGDAEAATRLEAVARKIAKAVGELEAAASRAGEAAGAAPVAPPVIHVVPQVIPEVPPVLASKIVEIKPAVLGSDHPFVAPAAAPAPIAKSEPAAPPAQPPALEAVAEPAPAAVTAAALPADPSPVAAAPEAPPPRKRSPRKRAPQPEAPAADLVLESPPAADSQSAPAAPEVSEPAVSADGATRLVVTAYIGIGNRLYIRGEGPGLSWERGVPLTFVSIGKWRWETNDASAPVRFKLYKNDETECSALGERSVAPGAQQELTASF